MIITEERPKIIGWHNFTWFDVRDPVIADMEKQIEKLLAEVESALDRHAPLQEMYAFMREHGKVLRTDRVPNIIPTAGRSVIASWLVGDNTVDADIGANYGALGTSSATPANSDTQLGAEVYRKATSSATAIDNIAYLSNFYSATEVTGTFQEAGWFLDGTASANTGELLSRFLTGTLTKTNIETLTVDSEITVS